ncbi:serine/threonine-protein kinase [Rosettibacter firmus]|uniref:serine/threonine-protein kinase n=1 Tax=Rosettibacter firmus TaxID=3111522 RepID=UPI00336BD6CE
MVGSTEILFEKFEIIDVLKKDDHAAVYLANHIYLSKKIILKVLNTEKISDQALIERFKREAKLLAKLDHPNIIKVLDFGTSKEFFYISFEYIEGESLRNLLKHKELTYEEKKSLTIQLFKALHFAHSNQIIHRDIKPENIFVDKNMNLKLGDFGLALSAEDNFVTSPYSIVGTPSYMSPEQVAGAKLNNQSDLFSAGVVVYEMFTGKNPFLKENVTLTLNEIMSYNENAIVEEISNVPDEIKNIITRLLKKKPAQRYNSALEVLNELNVQAEQLTVSIISESKKESKKNLLVLSASVLVVIFIGLLLFINKLQPDKISPEKKQLNQLTDKLNKEKMESSGIQTEKIESGSGVDKLDLKSDQTTNKESENSPLPAIKYGGLFVECYPWADVYVDGEKLETTPMNKPLMLVEGEHTIKLVHPDYPVYTKLIRINHSQVTNLRVSLESLMGYINCKVNPWGDVYVNGDYKGQTPLKDLIKVFPGFVRLTIKNPNYKEIDTSLYVQPGDTILLKFLLKNR